MRAATHHITIEAGATFRLFLRWLGPGRVPIDLTGYTARMQVRTSVDAASTVFSVVSGNGITLGGADGTITVEIPASETAAAIPPQAGPRRGVYDLELVAPDGVTVYRLVEGVAVLSPEVTR